MRSGVALAAPLLFCLDTFVDIELCVIVNHILCFGQRFLIVTVKVTALFVKLTGNYLLEDR